MQLVYFAWVRERIGKSDEAITLPEDVTTVADLVSHLVGLDDNYASALSDMSVIRVAVNQIHARSDQPVTDADEVAFFPPVTGG